MWSTVLFTMLISYAYVRTYVMVAGTQYVHSHNPYQDLGAVCSIGWSLLKPQNLIRVSKAAEQLNTHHTWVQLSHTL